MLFPQLMQCLVFLGHNRASIVKLIFGAGHVLRMTIQASWTTAKVVAETRSSNHSVAFHPTLASFVAIGILTSHLDTLNLVLP